MPQRRRRTILLLAAAYNLAWGAVVVVLPRQTLTWLGVESLSPPAIAFWQCIGMIVGVYGIGYALAATDSRRHWPIVLVGLLGKVLGPIGFLDSVFRGTLPWSMAWTLITNDLIWWLPFAALLRDARQSHANTNDNR